MIKKNHIIMKQPELGQRILELRKAKGLTQEELVDRCNINVRTIQRIEAGEVTPRTFTIKTILEALGYDLDAIRFQESAKDEKGNAVNAVNPEAPLLKAAFILGLIYFVLAFVESFVDMTVWGTYPDISFHDSISLLGYLFLKIMVCTTFGGFMFGLYRLSSQHRNALIKVGSLVLAGLTVVTTSIDSYSYYVGRAHLYFLPLQSIAFGAAYILFGIGLMKYRSVFGELAFFSGLLGVIAGFCLLTVFLALPGLVVITLLDILTLVLLFKAFDRSSAKLQLV